MFGAHSSRLYVTGMKSGQMQFLSNSDASKNEIPSQSIDRRRFLQYAAGVGAMAGLGGSVLGHAQNDAATGAAQPNPKAVSADSRLPDGTEFVFWEQPLTFSKTYYVDNQPRQGRRQRPRHERAALPHHQQGRPGAPARRTRGHRLRHLPRVRPPGARRHESGSDDQLRGRSGRKSFRQRL